MSQDLCWYVAYGSNMCFERFVCYLKGGCPPGGLRAYDGARDPTLPRDDRPYWLPGATYFARESLTWTGGLAFLDPTVDDAAPARAYLVTREQFSDVVAQEMSREPDVVLDLAHVSEADAVPMGPGDYETVIGCAPIEGVPAYTFTAPDSHPDTELAPPSAAYLRVLAQGLAETHGWSTQQAAEYLVRRPGADATWTVDTAVGALTSPPPGTITPKV